MPDENAYLNQSSGEFLALFAEFARAYPPTAEGRRHVESYGTGRVTGQQNYAAVQAATAAGQDITDLVLLKLLPHKDTAGNRDRGAWVHVAPVIDKDVRTWFEGKGWAEAGQWPAIARAIYDFIDRCTRDPGQLEVACQAFVALPFKGFQSAFLSPILNALRPGEFVIANTKTRDTINYFTGADYTRSLVDYPALNAAAKELIALHAQDMARLSGLKQMLPGDLFDMFCHWLVAIRQYDFRHSVAESSPPYEAGAESGEEGAVGAATRTGHLLALIRKTFPGWTGFTDPRFVREEVTYKQAAIELARQLLNRDELARLVEREDFGEMLNRLDRVGKKSRNLLYLASPRTGDLGILYQEHLDKAHFCRAMFDLLYGEGTGPERLGRYAAYVEADGLPNKWTFPTYFLFMCHPDTDMYVRPSVFAWLLDSVGLSERRAKKPGAEGYAAILGLVAELRAEFAAYGPRDMVDLQGAIWVAFSAARKGSRLGRPFDKMFSSYEQAMQAFDLLADTAERLGLSGPGDPRGAITLRRTKRRLHALHLDFGNWLILGFAGRAGQLHQLSLALLEDRVALTPLEKGDFKCYDDEPQIALFSFAAAQAWPLEAQLARVFEETLGQVVHHFRDWRKSPYAVYSDRKVAEAVFNPELRDKLLTEGIEAEVDEGELPVEVPPEGIVTPAPPPSPGTVPAPALSARLPEYPLEKCADETGVDLEILRRWVRAVERKGQVIFYGPPGTGKTYLADRLARHLAGGGDGFIDIVQFHPAYAYEDFIQGLRPQAVDDGGLRYDLVPGRFLEFCQRAAGCKDRCVLILDEINRANLARVFGELMFTLEYRKQSVRLAGGQDFCIPANVILIGTMNTADRSIALVDHALRRRFAFLQLYPDYEVLRRFHAQQETDFPVDRLIQVLRGLNEKIGDEHYAVGISFFLHADLATQLPDIWRMEIEPYLEEYFFDQRQAVDDYRWDKIAQRVMP